MRKSILFITLVLTLGCACACSSKDSASNDDMVLTESEEKKTENTDSKNSAKEEKLISEKTEDSEEWVKLDEAEEADESTDEEAEAKVTEEEKIVVDESVFSYEAIGDYEEVPVWTAQASSMLEDEDDYYRYHPEKLYDHDLATAYVEGAKDNGIGEMVEFDFGTGFEATTYAITRIEIYPGYQKSLETFENNSRPSRLSFYFPDGTYYTIDMEKGYGADSMFAIDMEPVVTNKCTMVIEGAETGKKFTDLCISEILFYSQETNGMMYAESSPFSEAGDTGISSDYVIKGIVGDKTVWTYNTHNPLTELSDSSYLTSGHGKVIVYNDQKVVALDALTGNELWEKADTGFPSAVSFDKDGNLYVCGYFGSEITVIDKDGNTVVKEENFAGEDYTWATMLAVKGDGEVSVYYAGYGDGDSEGSAYSSQLR